MTTFQTTLSQTFSGGTGFGGAIVGLIFLSFFVLALVLGYMYYNRIKVYRYRVIAFSESGSGHTCRLVKGGLVKRQKVNGFQFEILKPKRILNNFNREWVIYPTIKGKPTVFCFEQTDTDWIQLNPETLDLDGNKLKFIPRELGKEVFANTFRQNTELQFGLNDWFMNNKDKIVYGGLVFIQMIMVLLLINVSNKVM